MGKNVAIYADSERDVKETREFDDISEIDFVPPWLSASQYEKEILLADDKAVGIVFFQTEFGTTSSVQMFNKDAALKMIVSAMKHMGKVFTVLFFNEGREEKEQASA